MKPSCGHGLALIAAGLVAAPLAAFGAEQGVSIERGRYVATIAGCNDCHTPQYALNGGKTPEKEWLTGDTLGWRGPWGTTYATNLRLYFAGISEDEWVKRAKTLTARPPMPWFNVRAMTENDQRSLYRYVRSLGAGGQPAPSYVPPDREPSGPTVVFPAPPK